MIDARGDILQYGDRVMHVVQPIGIMEYDFQEIQLNGKTEICEYFHMRNGKTELASNIKSEHIIKLMR